MENFKSIVRSVLAGVFLGLFLAAIFAVGFFLRDVLDQQHEVQARVSYTLLDEVQELLDRVYLREQPSESARQYAAIKGMLTTLEDRNTFFIDPPVAASEADVLAGTYGGIGVSISRNETGEVVLYPFDDSPAIAAGIQTGMVLLEVNGVALMLSVPQDQIDQMLRGEVKDNNGVSLKVRDLAGEEQLFFVPFAVINVPSMMWRVLIEDTRIGYIQLYRFTNRTPEELLQAVSELNDEDIAALVLDVRDNGGGLLQESVDVAGEFIDEGAIAYDVSKADETVYDTPQGGNALDIPLAILVNGNTASAAEILAGAIQDTKRGLVIGQQTYGKGSIQQIYVLSDGSSLHVTFAEWLTPNRRSIDGIGITPDITMIPDPNGRDVELGEAIRELQKQLDEGN